MSKQISTETPEQRKARYRQNQKNREAHVRAERKREIAENNTANRRLSFLTNIITATGHNKNDIAKAIGTTQQAMSYYFSVKDDCRLSMAKTILDVIGLTLDVEIRKGGTKKILELAKKIEGTNSKVKFTIETPVEYKARWVNPQMPDYVNNCTPDKNLYFLALYLPTCGMPITNLMKKCGIQMASLSYMFNKDDMKISQIFKIAKATGGEIVWKVD